MNKEEMQNNYIEMLIQDLEKHSFDYWESTQDEMVEALRNLQQKVNQLEVNRDEAINFIKKTQFDCGEFNCCGFGIWENGKNELLEILERGKE